MTTRNTWRWDALKAAFALALVCRTYSGAFAQPHPPSSVRLRGPLHEALAAPVAGANRPGKTIEGRPGQPLEELPAAVKPSSPRTIWIGGYWGWDPREPGLVWIPGVWRVPPPGMRWVPGYWSEHEQGCRWVRGFWYPIKEPRLSYLPSPPQERARRAPAKPMSNDEFRVRGHWSYRRGEFVWDSDFTAAHKQGWVWIRSHWAWTPRGALYLPGYWDYALANRGIAFAPLSLDGSLEWGEKAERGQRFSPTVAVNLAKLSEAAFIAPGLGHYYFGDYFGGDPHNEMRPWFEPDSFDEVDPNFAYERWQRREQSDWRETLVEHYRERRSQPALRPPVELGAASDLEPTTPGLDISVGRLGRSSDADRSSEAGRPLVRLTPEAVQQAAHNAAVVKMLAEQRANLEAAQTDGKKAPLVFALPPPVAPLDRASRPAQPPSATAGQYVPGVTGREMPGAANRSVPGTTGRTVPGVDIRVPGATAPGVLPGADTGLKKN